MYALYKNQISTTVLASFIALAAWLLFVAHKPLQIFIVATLYLTIGTFMSWRSISFSELGASLSTAVRGLGWGAAVSALIVGVLLTIFIFWPSVFLDARYNLSFISYIREVFVRLPFMTVIVEELVFRGVLLALLMRFLSTSKSVAISSVLFGLWHIGTATAVTTQFYVPQPLIIVAVVVATSLAGALLAHLRIRSNSLIAPILVHWAINAGAITLARLAWIS